MAERCRLLPGCVFWGLSTGKGLPNGRLIRFSQSGCILDIEVLLLRKLCGDIGNRNQSCQGLVCGLHSVGFGVAHKLRRRVPLPNLKLGVPELIRKRDE